MQNNLQDQGPRKKKWLGCATSVLLFAAALLAGYFWLWQTFSGPREAPEAERVLAAQTSLPFQVLIPAYLPGAFDRERMEIKTGLTGPAGAALIQLVYSTPEGITLVLSEWLPIQQSAEGQEPGSIRCVCVCTTSQCQMFGAEVSVGPVRVRAELSIPNILSYDQIQLILATLGPATNLQVYSSMQSVPVAYSAPPAEEIPVNADGIQEIILVVTPQGYSPAHFSVKKDIPVRLIFRQLGEVGCGNELIFQWGTDQSATLVLASPSDKQVLEFTPAQSGEFRFNCSHQIFRGLMTVTD